MEEKDERLRRLHYENKVAKLQVSRLEKKILNWLLQMEYS